MGAGTQILAVALTLGVLAVLAVVLRGMDT